MSLRTMLILVLLVVLSWSPPVAAQGPSLVAVVGAGDTALDDGLVGVGATVAFFDANGNGRIDRQQPDEPIYLDTNHDAQVGYGDIRLTSFGWYPPGSLVDLSNADNGVRLTVTGWFASSMTNAWFVDADGSRSVTEGDLRLTGGQTGKVGPSDADRGTALQTAQTGASTANRVAARDTSGDGAYQPGEALYLDVDSSQGAGTLKVSTGDLRFMPSAAPIDRAPGTATPATTMEQSTVTVGADGTTTVVQQTNATGWRTLDWILVALAVANLAAFIFVVRTVKPRNPFK